MLVSYNTNAFESYSLKGNLNSGICTNCARNYIEALKFLTTNGIETLNSKEEKEFKYTNRQKISDDTIALFWTKVPDDNIDPWSDICQPTVERIKKCFLLQLLVILFEQEWKLTTISTVVPCPLLQLEQL